MLLNCKFLTILFHPNDLYKGIQRSSFIPCIELLKQELIVLSLNGLDYRLNGFKVDCFLLENDVFIDSLFSRLGNGSSKVKTIEFKKRNVTFTHTYNDILKTSFTEICINSLSEYDYIEITGAFKIILMSNVPLITDKNVLLRFIKFIDACYEARVTLIANLLENDFNNVAGVVEWYRCESRIKEMSGLDWVDERVKEALNNRSNKN